MLLLMFAARLNATNLHLSLAGSGNKDGSGWAHAFGPESLEKVVNEVMQPGDTLLIGPGAYEGTTLKISVGGKKELPKTIVGIDNGFGLPVFINHWTVEAPNKGTNVIDIGPDVSHVVIERLRIKGAVTGIHAPPVKEGSARTGLAFHDVDVSFCRYGFHLSNCDDVEIARCDLKRYTKHGFRLDQGCDRVLFSLCHSDCSEADADWETKTELLPFGFLVNDAGAPNTAIRFEDCLARNHMMPLQRNAYKNGDGFVVEANTVDVSFSRCRALRNQDGGFDLKAKDVRLTDCIGVGNSRTFRLWSSAALSNCLAGWADVGIWSNGGPITADHCTFHELSETAVLADDEATGPVMLSECLISATPKPYRSSENGKVALHASLISDAPDYHRPTALWDGLGDAMNSRAHPDKGFHSELILGEPSSR